MLVLFLDLRSGSHAQRKCLSYLMIVAAVISLYLAPIAQWVFIYMSKVSGVWAICIAWSMVCFVLFASFKDGLMKVLYQLFLATKDGNAKPRPVIPYKDIVREDGEGSLRIGTPMLIREDAYSMAMISYCMNHLLDNAL